MKFFNRKSRQPMVEIDIKTLGKDKADHGRVLWAKGQMYMFDLPTKRVLAEQVFRALQKKRAEENRRTYSYKAEARIRKRRTLRNLAWDEMTSFAT